GESGVVEERPVAVVATATMPSPADRRAVDHGGIVGPEDSRCAALGQANGLGWGPGSRGRPGRVRRNRVTPHCDGLEVTKTAEQLDDMVSHVRYEVLSLLGFLRFGSAWIQNITGMPDGLDKFLAQNMLEAALIHTRCVAEFLRRSDDKDEELVIARDYVPG